MNEEPIPNARARENCSGATNEKMISNSNPFYYFLVEHLDEPMNTELDFL